MNGYTDKVPSLRNSRTSLTGEKSHHQTVDKIIDSVGYGVEQWKMIIFTTLVISIEGMHFNLFSLMLIPLSKQYDLTDFQIQIISGILFIGVFLGSFFSGHMIQRIKRIRLINFFMFLTFVLHFSMAFVNSIFVFSIIRVLLGFCIGVFIPLQTNLLCEYVPTHLRSFFFNSTWAGYNFGALFLTYTMLYVIPDFDPSGIKRTLLYSSILPGVTFLILIIFLKDSPRNLILLDEDDNAIAILENMLKTPISPKDRHHIIDNVKNGVNKEISNNFSDLFQPQYKFLTILLIVLWAFIYMLYYGPFLITSWVLKEIATDDKTHTNEDIIQEEIVIFFIGMIGYFVGGTVSEIRIFGRKRAIMIGLFLCIIFTYLAIANPHNFVLFFSIYFIFLNLPLIIIDVYSCEVYPTKIRDMAVGFFFSCCRLGSFVANVLFVMFFRINIFAPYYFVIFLCVCLIYAIYLLPFETFGVPLDTDHSAANSMKNLGTELLDFDHKKNKNKLFA